MIFYSTKENVDKLGLIEKIVEAAAQHVEEMEVGVSAMEDHGFVVRALGHGGELMYNFFLLIQDILWDLDKKDVDALCLAPNQTCKIPEISGNNIQ